MENKIRELLELRRMQEELTTEIEALTDAIKAEMGDSESLCAGAYNITSVQCFHQLQRKVEIWIQSCLTVFEITWSITHSVKGQ